MCRYHDTAPLALVIGQVQRDNNRCSRQYWWRTGLRRIARRLRFGLEAAFDFDPGMDGASGFSKRADSPTTSPISQCSLNLSHRPARLPRYP
jgi:hypothetical protein